MGATPLSTVDIVVAGGLVLVAGIVSLLLRLNLHKRLLLASVRTTVQLLMIGYVLRWLFEIDAPWLLILILLFMTVAAGLSAVGRSERTFAGVHLRAIVALVVTGTLTTFTVTAVIIEVRPWYDPQYVIPLMGMVLGNTLTGVSLCIDTLLEALSDRADQVEMALAHGATRWEAARECVASAVRRGMIPIINAMMVVGIVSLPGMMTGQILEGADPVSAVKYQMVVMFMLAASCALASVLMALFIFRRLFNARHQLRWEKIRKRS